MGTVKERRCFWCAEPIEADAPQSYPELHPECLAFIDSEAGAEARKAVLAGDHAILDRAIRGGLKAV